MSGKIVEESDWPHCPVWEWDCLPLIRQQRAYTLFCGVFWRVIDKGETNAVAASRAHCAVVARIAQRNGFVRPVGDRKVHIASELRKDRFYRSSDAIGLRIIDGTWPDEKGTGEIDDSEIAPIGKILEGL